MKFRLDFKEKLDLSRLKKQIPFYIGIAQSLVYDLYLPDYRMSVEIETPTTVTAHHVAIRFDEIIRNQEGDITQYSIIYPLTDTRFQELRAIQDVFVSPGYYKAEFNSNSATDTCEKICKILTILFKINKLKVFL